MCSITRDNLGPYKTKVLLLPTVYFLTSLVGLHLFQLQLRLNLSSTPSTLLPVRHCRLTCYNNTQVVSHNWQVVDYAQYLVSWQSVCNLGTLEDTEAAPLYDLPGWVFFIANLASV